MSTTDSASEAKGLFAMLVRGRVYFYKGREFLNGDPQSVTAEERAYLEANAVDYVSVEGEAEYQARPKFRFTDTKPETKRTAVARTRARA